MKGMDSTDTICTFCRIVRGDEPAHIVYEDVASIAFLDREPAGEDLEWHAIWDQAEGYYFSEVRPPADFDLVVSIASPR
jgi:hypothetical protein